MTDKEALKEWIDHYRIDCHKYCGYSFLEKLKIIEKDLDKLDKVEEKLTKYERVFEIFERLLNDKFVYIGFDDEKFIFNGFIDITDEEYELLEELMKL